MGGVERKLQSQVWWSGFIGGQERLKAYDARRGSVTR
jgi:hypothetical protein